MHHQGPVLAFMLAGPRVGGLSRFAAVWWLDGAPSLCLSLVCRLESRHGVDRTTEDGAGREIGRSPEHTRAHYHAVTQPNKYPLV
jgi:hypothetical protein